jgi:hypothetical protein
MSLFLKGLVTGLIGVALLTVGYVSEALRQRPSVDPDEVSVLLVSGGLGMLIAGPLVFWVLIPIVRRMSGGVGR